MTGPVLKRHTVFTVASLSCCGFQSLTLSFSGEVCLILIRSFPRSFLFCPHLGGPISDGTDFRNFITNFEMIAPGGIRYGVWVPLREIVRTKKTPEMNELE